MHSEGSPSRPARPASLHGAAQHTAALGLRPSAASSQRHKPHLLIVSLKALGHHIVDHKPHVGLVDACGETPSHHHYHRAASQACTATRGYWAHPSQTRWWRLPAATCLPASCSGLLISAGESCLHGRTPRGSLRPGGSCNTSAGVTRDERILRGAAAMQQRLFNERIGPMGC